SSPRRAKTTSGTSATLLLTDAAIVATDGTSFSSNDVSRRIPTLAKHRALASEVNLLLAREEKEFLTKD
ncbi:MAG: hypothetical protein ACKO97_11455, partial [Actinomycetota bacterium]